MIGKNSSYRVLQEFFDRPGHKFQIRELSRTSGISFPSVRVHVRALDREGLVRKVREGVYESYVGNTEDRGFRLYKAMDMVVRIHESGLVNALERGLSYPAAIVLFGSCAEGTDTERSDADIFVLAREKELDLKRYERQLKRKISLHFMDREGLKKSGKSSPELVNNIANGIVLYGYLKVL
jgi:predicted nucleotidyltransferase